MFKVGDRVEIIDESGSSSAFGLRGQVGRVFFIDAYTRSLDEVIVKIEMNDGTIVSMFAKRFKLYEPAMMQYDPKQQGDTEDDI